MSEKTLEQLVNEFADMMKRKNKANKSFYKMIWLGNPRPRDISYCTSMVESHNYIQKHPSFKAMIEKAAVNQSKDNGKKETSIYKHIDKVYNNTKLIGEHPGDWD